MEPGGGEKHAKLSSDAGTTASSEDRLSASLTISWYPSSSASASPLPVLSHRWCRIWTLLPDLFFPSAPDPHQIGPALKAHEAALRCLFVGTRDAPADSVAAWLPLTVRRLSGFLFFQNTEQERSAHTKAKATTRRPRRGTPLSSPAWRGFLGLTVPSAGVFARLTELVLARVWLHGPGRLPPAAAHHPLESLKVTHHFFYSQNEPIASVSAPQLVTLAWTEPYDPSSVHLGKMKRLRSLSPFFFVVYGQPVMPHNDSCSSLFWHFKVVERLILTRAYLWAQTTCSLGCICSEHQNWENGQLSLNRLREIEIIQLRGSEHELFKWATLLEKMTIAFDNSLSESVAKELTQVLRSLSRPEVHVEILTYGDMIMKMCVSDD
ncbi:hypothetical protein U9M48_010153 [Paspalum notatum var. saurae]|uniref:Uncharacterized protein n=1 Tax=Paspalum notatum var. saurae TaxID=547442 RepID=A0AAQ3SSH3_PASNO